MNKISLEYVLFTVLIIFIIGLLIYYVVTNMRKRHHNMIEKFALNVEHPPEPKFRKCEVYFLNDVEIKDVDKCDIDYAANPETSTCKYVYDGWQERSSETDETGNPIMYPKKIFRNGILDTGGYANYTENTRCFKEITGDVPSDTTENVHRFGNRNYLFQEFTTSDSFNTNVCDMRFTVGTTIKSLIFYKFILDKTNKIKDVKRVRIKNDEKGFLVDPKFTIGTFTKGQSYGIEYLRFDAKEKKHVFNIFQITKFPERTTKVYTFRYNYVCQPSTQVMHKATYDVSINVGSFIKFPSSSGGKEYSFPMALPNGGDTFSWNDFKNRDRDPDKKVDKRQLMITKLTARKAKIIERITASLKAREEALAVEWDDIQTQIGCDSTCLTQFVNNNKQISDILRRIFTSNKISSFKNEFRYITKEADTSNRVYDDVIIRVRNTFSQGLTKYVIDMPTTYLESMTVFDDTILTKFNSSKDNASFNNFTRLFLNSNRLNYFTGFFYVPLNGKYKFMIRANTPNLTANALYVNTTRVFFSKSGEGQQTEAFEFKKFDIVRIDICFARYPQDTAYTFGWKFASNTGYNLNSATPSGDIMFITKISPLNENSKSSPFLNGRFLMKPKIISESTGEYYYEFKDFDLLYGIEIKHNTLCDILVVGGGGSSGNGNGTSWEPGGGGGGGVVYMKNVTLPSGVYAINIGRGGNNGNGFDSSITNSSGEVVNIDGINIIGFGGGKGGEGGVAGANGGSGGGGTHFSGHGTATQGNTFWNGFIYTAGGHNGRSGGGYPGSNDGGGGGGVGGPGGAGGPGSSRDFKDIGGSGKPIDISGVVTYYGAGGSGSGHCSGMCGGDLREEERVAHQAQKSGGDGRRNPGNKFGQGFPAFNGTGGGGGGGFGHGGNPAMPGGSGIVIIRVKMSSETKVSGIDFSKQNIVV